VNQRSYQRKSAGICSSAHLSPQIAQMAQIFPQIKQIAILENSA
jgi:hypothetical protein